MRRQDRILKDALKILQELADHPATPDMGATMALAWLMLVRDHPEWFVGEKPQKPRRARVYWPREIAV